MRMDALNAMVFSFIAFSLLYCSLALLFALIAVLIIHAIAQSLEARKTRSLASAWRSEANCGASDEEPAVVIVGAGFGGLLAAIRFRAAGVPFLVLEKSSGPGGVWFSNTYPGAACDVPAQLYSFSFDHNPEWPSAWPSQPEILEYIRRVFRKHDLQRHTRFNASVTGATWNEAMGKWTIDYVDLQGANQSVNSVYLVIATGQLSQPKWPNVDLTAFKGQCFHSAEWPQHTDFSNKRVLCVGAAASAVQLVPEVAKTCDKLYVLQRTPNYVLPKGAYAYNPLIRWLFRHLLPVRLLYRFWIYCSFEARWPAFWKDSWLNKHVRGQLIEEIKKKITPENQAHMLPKVLPTDTLGCRRILIADEWYSTLQKPHVELLCGSLDKADRASVTVKANGTGERSVIDVDVIICASGFDTTRFTGGLAPHIRGVGGATLSREWQNDARAYAYNGMCVPSFPNMFIMYGPNTNLGHNSILIMLETQASYMVTLLADVLARGHTVLEVTREAAVKQQLWMQQNLAGTVWAAECNSWYKTGNGIITNNWCASTLCYMYMLWSARLQDFVTR